MEQPRASRVSALSSPAALSCASMPRSASTVVGAAPTSGAPAAAAAAARWRAAASRGCDVVGGEPGAAGSGLSRERLCCTWYSIHSS